MLCCPALPLQHTTTLRQTTGSRHGLNPPPLPHASRSQWLHCGVLRTGHDSSPTKALYCGSMSLTCVFGKVVHHNNQNQATTKWHQTKILNKATTSTENKINPIRDFNNQRQRNIIMNVKSDNQTRKCDNRKQTKPSSRTLHSNRRDF